MSNYSLYSIYIYTRVSVSSELVQSFDSNLPQVIPRTGPLFSSTFLTQNVLEISPPLSIHLFFHYTPSLSLFLFLSRI